LLARLLSRAIGCYPVAEGTACRGALEWSALLVLLPLLLGHLLRGGDLGAQPIPLGAGALAQLRIPRHTTI
jgi:hypothetical protein